MTYRKYFDSDDPNGPDQFYDAIAGQAASRTMGRDEKGAYVEYEPLESVMRRAARTILADREIFQFDDSGFIDISRLPVLPLAVALVAGYAIHFMVMHGIFANLSILAR